MTAVLGQVGATCYEPRLLPLTGTNIFNMVHVVNTLYNSSQPLCTDAKKNKLKDAIKFVNDWQPEKSDISLEDAQNLYNRLKDKEDEYNKYPSIKKPLHSCISGLLRKLEGYLNTNRPRRH